MRKTVSVFLGFAVLLFSSCETGDKKIPEIATDFCNCFYDLEKKLSTTTKGIWQKAANAANPKSTMKIEMDKLNAPDKEKVKREILLINESEDKDSEVGRCMEAIGEKYNNARRLDETEFYQKLIKELESKTGCKFTAAAMKLGMGLKQK
jgi:hypothetical protein